MSFAQDNGYTPVSFNDLMTFARLEINEQFGTTYTAETFVGTNWYKFLYGPIQKIQENEVKTSEIFVKLQEYIAITNERIQRPTVSAPGLIESFLAEGYTISVKPPLEADAGMISICALIAESVAGKRASGSILITSYANLVSGTDDTVTVGATAFTAQTGAATPGTATFQAAVSNEDTAESLALQINEHATAGALVQATAFGALVVIKALDEGVAGNSIALNYTDNDANVGATKSGTALTGGTDAAAGYAATKLAVATLIKNFVAAGIVSQGTESESIALSNGQSFDFKFYLPNRNAILLRLTIALSENSLLTIPEDEEIREALFDNLNERYGLGLNFEPQRYFTFEDAPWAESILLEYSLDDGDTYSALVRDTDFDELLTFGLDDITLVIS